MKVVFFNREKRTGNFSIEELFSLLKNEFKSEIEFDDFHYEPKKSRLANIFNAKKFQGTVNHITGDINFIGLGLNKKSTILTIHDLGYYENPVHNRLKKIIYKQFWFNLPLKNVSYITTVSQFTKNKILQHFNFDSTRIKVIYNPYNPYFKYCPKPFNEQKPKILLIGTGPHKNFNRLFEAVKNISCQLIIIGKLEDQQTGFLKENQIEFENYFSLSTDEVYKKYQECDMLFFASLYEGFGIPIIEANAVGRPVITSNLASMPEVANDAALLVNPYNIEEIKDAIQKIIDQPELREKLINKGQKNIQRFALSTITKEYLELYKIVAKQAQ